MKAVEDRLMELEEYARVLQIHLQWIKGIAIAFGVTGAFLVGGVIYLENKYTALNGRADQLRESLQAWQHGLDDKAKTALTGEAKGVLEAELHKPRKVCQIIMPGSLVGRVDIVAGRKSSPLQTLGRPKSVNGTPSAGKRRKVQEKAQGRLLTSAVSLTPPCG
jgi:hypothetical protein